MASRPLVLITNRFDQKLRLKLASMTEVDFQFKADLFSDQQLLQKAQGLIIRSSTSVDEDFLNKFPQLKYVVTATSGFDHIDLEGALRKKVKCYHVPETQSVAAAELTLLLILGACRKFSLAQSQLQRGDWQRSLLLGRQLSGQNLGIIGLGRVGREVARRAAALGLNVSAYDPFIEDHDPAITMRGFEELMRASDIITLHVPKTKKTRHMIKRETLNWMNTNGTLINMSRGDVVNEADLINHLLENPDFSAGLDVFAKEPLATKSPLLELKNVILTPHVGASTEEALRASSEKALEKVLALFRGEGVDGELPPQAPWFGE